MKIESSTGKSRLKNFLSTMLYLLVILFSMALLSNNVFAYQVDSLCEGRHLVLIRGGILTKDGLKLFVKADTAMRK